MMSSSSSCQRPPRRRLPPCANVYIIRDVPVVQAPPHHAYVHHHGPETPCPFPDGCCDDVPALQQGSVYWEPSRLLLLPSPQQVKVLLVDVYATAHDMLLCADFIIAQCALVWPQFAAAHCPAIDGRTLVDRMVSWPRAQESPSLVELLALKATTAPINRMLMNKDSMDAE